MLRYLSSFALIALLAGPAVASGQDRQVDSACFRLERAVCEASLVVAIADGDQLDRLTINVVGYLGRHKGEMRLYTTEDAALVGDLASSIRVLGVGESVDQDLENMAEAYVRVFGEFRSVRDNEANQSYVLAQRLVLLMRPDGRDAVREILKPEPK